MTDRIDHAGESHAIMLALNEGVIAQEGVTDATIIATAIDALRHATLALAEQARIANLIALLRGDASVGAVNAAFAALTGPHAPHPLHPHIAAALGLDPS